MTPGVPRGSPACVRSDPEVRGLTQGHCDTADPVSGPVPPRLGDLHGTWTDNLAVGGAAMDGDPDNDTREHRVSAAVTQSHNRRALAVKGSEGRGKG